MKRNIFILAIVFLVICCASCKKDKEAVITAKDLHWTQLMSPHWLSIQPEEPSFKGLVGHNITHEKIKEMASFFNTRQEVIVRVNIDGKKEFRMHHFVDEGECSRVVNERFISFINSLHDLAFLPEGRDTNEAKWQAMLNVTEVYYGGGGYQADRLQFITPKEWEQVWFLTLREAEWDLQYLVDKSAKARIRDLSRIHSDDYVKSLFPDLADISKIATKVLEKEGSNEYGAELNLYTDRLSMYERNLLDKGRKQEYVAMIWKHFPAGFGEGAVPFVEREIGQFLNAKDQDRFFKTVNERSKKYKLGIYIVREGDTAESIARFIYGNEQYGILLRGFGDNLENAGQKAVRVGRVLQTISQETL